MQTTHPDLILSIEAIIALCKELEATMAEAIQHDNLHDLCDREVRMMAFLGTMANAVPSAAYHLAHRKKMEYNKIMARIAVKQSEGDRNDDKAIKAISQPSILKDYVNSRCENEIWLHEYTVRAQSNLTHYLDNLRTLISKEKTLMQMQQFGGQGV